MLCQGKVVAMNHGRVSYTGLNVPGKVCCERHLVGLGLGWDGVGWDGVGWDGIGLAR